MENKIPEAFKTFDLFKRHLLSEGHGPRDISAITITVFGCVRIIQNAATLCNIKGKVVPKDIMNYLLYIGSDRDVFFEILYQAALKAFEVINECRDESPWCEH